MFTKFQIELVYNQTNTISKMNNCKFFSEKLLKKKKKLKSDFFSPG